MVGIRPGSSLLVAKPVALTCSTEYTSSTQSIEWLVNAEHVWEDVNLLTEAGQIISNMMFLPQIGDVVVECKVIKKQVRSTFVFFTVENETKIVTLQKALVLKTETSPWIPFDIRKWKINRLDSSAEESAITYSKDIYQFMNDEPKHDVDSFNMKKFTEHHHKKNQKFVEQVQPISLPLASYSAVSSARMQTAKLSVIFLTLVLSVAS